MKGKAELQVSSVEAFVDGRAKVFCKNWGMVDETLNWIIPPKFAEIHEFSEGLSWAAPARTHIFKKGVIDLKGDWVLKPNFKLVTPFQESVSWACKKEGPYIPAKERPDIRPEAGLFSLVNSDGKIQIKARFSGVSGFVNGIAWVQTRKTGQLWGAVDKQGTFLIEPTYEKMRGRSWYQDWSWTTEDEGSKLELKLGKKWYSEEEILLEFAQENK